MAFCSVAETSFQQRVLIHIITSLYIVHGQSIPSFKPPVFYSSSNRHTFDNRTILDTTISAMPNFLDLPAELRVKIYRNLYVVGTVDLTDNTFSSIDYHRALNPSQCHFCPTSLKKAKTSGRPYILAATEARRFLENEFIETFCFASSQFLRCSKLVYHESMPILYSENTFWLTNACQLRNFLRDCSDVARYSISSLLFQHASRFNLVPSRGGPESKLLPNLKKLQFYASSHSERPHHCPSTEWDGLLIDTTPKGEDDPNGKDEWAKALRKGNPGDEFLRRLYKKHPSVQCGILVEQYVGRLSINQDYWVSTPSPKLYI